LDPEQEWQAQQERQQALEREAGAGAAEGKVAAEAVARERGRLLQAHALEIEALRLQLELHAREHAQLVQDAARQQLELHTREHAQLIQAAAAAHAQDKRALLEQIEQLQEQLRVAHAASEEEERTDRLQEAHAVEVEALRAQVELHAQERDQLVRLAMAGNSSLLEGSPLHTYVRATSPVQRLGSPHRADSQRPRVQIQVASTH
jgi:hypothetical protein